MGEDQEDGYYGKFLLFKFVFCFGVLDYLITPFSLKTNVRIQWIV